MLLNNPTVAPTEYARIELRPGMIPRATPSLATSRHRAFQPARLNDASELTLDQFSNLYMDERDGLAYRRLRGEGMTRREQARLDWLNSILERLLPQPVTLPREALDAMRELRVLSASVNNGQGRPT